MFRVSTRFGASGPKVTCSLIDYLQTERSSDVWSERDALGGGAKGVNISQSRKHRGEDEGVGWSSNRHVGVKMWQKFTSPDVVKQ